jgi:hypothetical protein
VQIQDGVDDRANRAVGFALLGYLAAPATRGWKKIAGRASAALLAILVLAILIVLIRRRRRPENDDAQSDDTPPGDPRTPST